MQKSSGNHKALAGESPGLLKSTPALARILNDVDDVPEVDDLCRALLPARAVPRIPPAARYSALLQQTDIITTSTTVVEDGRVLGYEAVLKSTPDRPR